MAQVPMRRRLFSRPEQLAPEISSDLSKSFQDESSAKHLASERLGEQSILDWLHISWFYPEGFTAIRFAENEQSYFAIGEKLIYKFLKSEVRGEKLTVQQRWKTARKELAENSSLARGLFLGIRLLRWSEGTPVWLAALPSHSESENVESICPEQADEVVLVLRRIDPAVTLESALSEDKGISSSKIRALCLKLAKFHNEQSRKSSKKLSSVSQFELAPERILEQLRSFVTNFAYALDPFSRTALQSSMAFLDLFVQENLELLRKRQQQGAVTEIHGDCIARNICVAPISEGLPRISIYNRSQLTADVLLDLSQLIIDLQIRGQNSVSEEIVENYRSRVGELYQDQVLRFYLVVAALQGALNCFQGEQDENVELIPKYLAIAVRHTFCLPKKYAVFVVGTAIEESLELSTAMAELTDTKCVCRELVAAELPGYTPLEDTLFQRLLMRVQQEISDEKPVIACWPCNTEELWMLEKLCSKLKVGFVVVRCEVGPVSCGIPKSDSQVGSPGDSRAPLISERILPQGELAIQILATLAQRVRVGNSS